MNTKCRISSPTKDGLQNAINKYFLSTSWIITEYNKIYNTSKEVFLDGYMIKKSNGRWQLREIID